MSDHHPNTPPADELYAVRAEIKELTERERVLRALMLTDPSARTGNKYIAIVKDIKTTRIDTKEMRAMYADLVAEFTHVVTDSRVELRGIDEDGVITPVRALRHEPV